MLLNPNLEIIWTSKLKVLTHAYINTLLKNLSTHRLCILLAHYVQFSLVEFTIKHESIFSEVKIINHCELIIFSRYYKYGIFLVSNAGNWVKTVWSNWGYSLVNFTTLDMRWVLTWLCFVSYISQILAPDAFLSYIMHCLKDLHM
jgi:hypothetical protein